MSTELASGQILLGRYRLDRRLDEGGMSVVWAGTHLLTGKQVALKLLKADAAKDEATRRRMLREARAACAVVHPNVVQIHDVLERSDGSPVLVMDLLNGEPLRERLRRRKALPVDETATLLLPVISAVGTAHAAGVIHRDLKPENIFLAQEGGRLAVKVLDFGIAKLVASAAANHASLINALTNTGTMLGTPYYMAPEQILDEPIDHRADIWSLGIILYECLTGERPTEAENVGRILKRVLTNDLTPLSSKAPELPPEITSLVERMLSQDANERPASLHEVGEVLAPFAHGVAMGSFGPPSRARDPDSDEARGSGPPAGRGSGPPAARTSEPPVPATQRSGPGPDGAPTPELADTLVAPRPGDVAPAARDSSAASGAGANGGSEGTTSGVDAKGGSAGANGEPPATLQAPGIHPVGRRTGPLVIAGVVVAAAAVAALGGLYLRNRKARPPYVAASASATLATPGGPCPDGMRLVSGGKLRMGADDGKDDERPVHELSVASFCLDRTEVRAADYFDCMQRGECRPAESTVRWMEIPDDVLQRESAHCTIYQTAQQDLPMNCVSWSDADAFCRAVGKRLPTEVEWEYAASGGAEHRQFPWGNAPPGPELVNACDRSCVAAESGGGGAARPMFDADDGAPTIAPVGRYPKGASRFGMLDMAGNVWEWTSSPYCTYPEHACTSPYRVFRGGGWGGKFVSNLRVSARLWSHPSHRYNDVGIRCARDLR